ncbi:MAG TPA: transcription elongation factor GreA [Thermomicrobiales bacterium]|nr:transcription elongation factor GreA [Thermomicrobiales bacterium]
MDEKVHVTEEGLATLRAEYEDLITNRRPAIIQTVALAREEGDLRENSGYHAARHDQTMIEGRIRQLEDMLKRVEVIDSNAAAKSGGLVRLGTTVTIEIDGEQETYTIVGSVESNPLEGRISDKSPWGQALLGSKVGQTVNIQTPTTVLKAKVISVT